MTILFLSDELIKLLNKKNNLKPDLKFQIKYKCLEILVYHLNFIVDLDYNTFQDRSIIPIANKCADGLN